MLKSRYVRSICYAITPGICEIFLVKATHGAQLNSPLKLMLPLELIIYIS